MGQCLVHSAPEGTVHNTVYRPTLYGARPVTHYNRIFRLSNPTSKFKVFRTAFKRTFPIKERYRCFMVAPVIHSFFLSFLRSRIHSFKRFFPSMEAFHGCRLVVYTVADPDWGVQYV